jgi:hypothetical protein
MEFALNEVKIQAKKLLKSFKTDDISELRLQKYLKRLTLKNLDELKLKHCLTLVSQELGLVNWHQAQFLLIGDEKIIKPDNFGTFFYPDSCGGFINEWFNDYQQAKLVLLQKTQTKWLLPYKNQFLVVGKDYIKQFGMDEKLWREIEHDMVKSYNTSAWDKLCCGIIKNRKRAY